MSAGLGQKFRTIALVLINIGVLVAVFSFPPMSLHDTYRYYPGSETGRKVLDRDTDRFVRAELKKGIDEIQMRLQDESSWFHYKFLLVGGLLAGFLGLFQYAQIRSPSNGKPRDSGAELERTLQGPIATVALAAICSLSLMIDLHIRGNAIVVNQIGLWIASHVEPAYLGLGARDVLPYSFTGWETFLRRGDAMHTDLVNSITFFWPIHILTIICFLLYLVSARAAMVSRKSTRIKLELLAFWLVHSCFIVLAWTGHYLPPVFRQAIPWLGHKSGVSGAAPYAVLAVALTIFNWFFVIQKGLRPRHETRKAE